MQIFFFIPASSKFCRLHCCWRVKQLTTLQSMTWLYTCSDFNLWMVILKHRWNNIIQLFWNFFFLLFTMSSMIIYFSEWPMQLPLSKSSELLNEHSPTQFQLPCIGIFGFVNSWHAPAFKSKFCFCISVPLWLTFKILHYIDT